MARSNAMGFALGFTLFVGLLSCCAQDRQENAGDVFWEVRQRQEAGAAAQLVLAGDPWTRAALRELGYRWKVWREPEFLGATAPTLNAAWLDELRDGTTTPVLRGKADDEVAPDQLAYVKVLSQALVFAHDTPVDAFAKSAEENLGVTFAQLWRDPRSYRGKVISIDGRLARVRTATVPSEARRKGVPALYEGWIFGPTRHSHPFWVMFTTLPDGLKVAEEMDRKVTFTGYFLKKIKYGAGDGSKFLETPLLVGPTITLVDKPPPPPDTPISMTVIACVVVVIGAVGIALVLLSWYFHRGDEALKRRLARMQTERAVTFADDSTPGGTSDKSKMASKLPPRESGGGLDFD